MKNNNKIKDKNKNQDKIKNFLWRSIKMKKEVVVMAFDDSPHNREDLNHYRKQKEKLKDAHGPAHVDLIGVVFRGHQLLYCTQDKIEVDGLDSTNKIIDQVLNCPYLNEIRLILIDSPTLGGFNVVDSQLIYEKTKIPVLLLPDEKPKERMVNVYKKIFPQRKEQISWLASLPVLKSAVVKVNQNPVVEKRIYFHAVGIKTNEVKGLLNYLCEYSTIPEPLRTAHIIASRGRK